MRTKRLWVLACVAALAACADVGPAAVSTDANPAAVKAALEEGGDVADASAVARYTRPPASKGVQKVGAQIGPAGGTLRLHDFEVVVPAGAVSTPTRFEIMLLPESAGEKHAWAMFKPHNMSFAVPVTLRVPFDATESAGAEGAHVLWWDGSAWVELETRETEDGRLETTTDHFSLYATQRVRGITMVGG